MSRSRLCTCFAAPAIAEGSFLCGRYTDAVSRPSDTSPFALVSLLINFGCLINTPKGKKKKKKSVGFWEPPFTPRERAWKDHPGETDVPNAPNDITGATWTRRDAGPGPGPGPCLGSSRAFNQRLETSFPLVSFHLL